METSYQAEGIARRKRVYGIVGAQRSERKVVRNKVREMGKIQI